MTFIVLLVGLGVGVLVGLLGVGGGVMLLIPGVFLGRIVGGRLAEKLKPQRMRQVFAGTLFALGVWQALGAWWR